MKKRIGWIAVLIVLPVMIWAENFWVGVFAKNTPYTGQAYTTSKSLPHLKSAIDKEWEKGSDIIDISYGHDVWMVLYARGTGYAQQAYMHRRDLKKFSKTVEAYRSKGFNLVNIEYGAGE